MFGGAAGVEFDLEIAGGVEAAVAGADLMAEFCLVFGGAGVGDADDEGDAGGRGREATEGEGACRAWKVEGGARSWTAKGSEVRARRISTHSKLGAHEGWLILDR